MDLSWKSSTLCRQMSLLNSPKHSINVQKVRFSSFKQQKSERLQQELASNLFPKKAKVDSSVGIKQFCLLKRKKLEEDPFKKANDILEKREDFCKKTETACEKEQENSRKTEEQSAENIKPLSCLKYSGPGRGNGNPMTDCLKSCACEGKKRRTKSPAEDQCLKASSSSSSPSDNETSSQLCETLKCLQAIESLTKKIAKNLHKTSKEMEAKEETVLNEPTACQTNTSKEEDKLQKESTCDCMKKLLIRCPKKSKEDKQCKQEEEEAEEHNGKLGSSEDSKPQLCTPATEENWPKSNEVCEQVMDTLSASKSRLICEEEGEKNVEDREESNTCAEEECVRDQTVQKGLKGLTVALPESEETVSRDMGILRQCLLKNRNENMPIVQPASDEELEEAMCKGRKYLCKIQKLSLGEKLLVGEEIDDGTDPGPFCEENGVEKVLKCALVRDEKNREKFVCTEVYPKALKIGKAMQGNYPLNRNNKIKITSNKLVCRTCPAVDGSGRKEIFCSMATVEEIKTPSETIDSCQPLKDRKKPEEKNAESLINYKDFQRKCRESGEKNKEEEGKNPPT